jgi:hypothetical protein
MELLLEFEISNQHSEKLPPSCHHEDEGICSLRFSTTVHDDVDQSIAIVGSLYMQTPSQRTDDILVASRLMSCTIVFKRRKQQRH